MTAVEGSILGNAVLRREDPTLLTGADEYYDDLKIPGLAHVHFVRSTIAHATIESVDISEAEGMPGVLAIYTAEGYPGADLDLAPHLPMPLLPPHLAMPIPAKDRVRFVGDIVAVVVAETQAQAIDAGESIWFDYEPLPVVVDPVAAIAPDAPVLFEENGSNICFAVGIAQEDGDPCEGAAHITELTMTSQRLAAVPIEPNGAIAIPEGADLMYWLPSQSPISTRDALAGGLGLDPANVRVAAPTGVGGGFGPKSGAYAEMLLAGKAAQTLGRPVKWTEVRSENMVSLQHGRGMVLKGRMGFDADGTIVGFDAEVIAEAGAYPAIGAILIMFTQTMIQGVYTIPKLRYDAKAVVTNTTPTGAYRGAGRPEATQLLERLLDLAADEMNVDPADLRRKNLIPADAFPITTHGGANYDSGEYVAALDKALEAADYPAMLAEQKARRDSADPKQIGIGVSTYVEVTAPAGLHVEFGAVEVDTDGKVTARVGTSAHGQGHVTSFSMIVADMLGVPMEDVTIVQSDTDVIPRGSGTMGSRSLQTAGSAVHVASETVLDKAKQLAAHLLEASVADIVKADGGGLQVAGVPANALSWAELATAASDDAKRPDGMDPGLAHELDFDGSDATFPFGAHVSYVEVDTETGQVSLLRHVAVDDCGRILNPMIVTGQQHGGIAQGVAQALFEHVTYDEDGNPTAGNLMDYAIPSAAELISWETINTETPSPRNPLGAKGIGESGTIGSTPALHNAVIDAVSHLGVRHIEMPMTPMKIWNAIQEASS
ncbi:MAG: xanthine dehydrogenase family protein molybdopterin-binding subunit [Acidimicrobiales bacterium]|nr:xanthine dehydrogenase family protein molybdopterin-binding subunit [Acidimicrobiales bacterium]